MTGEVTPNDKALGDGKTCFIVGPIGNRLAPVGSQGRLIYENAAQMWENVFEPACEQFSLTPVRADKISQSGDIPEQIFTYLRDAEVVVCDVTGGNANVMYELGLRHSRDLLTLQIGEYERLPFDVNTVRTIQFNRTEAGLIDARNTLIEFLRAGLKGDAAPVAATRVFGLSGAALDENTIANQALLSYESDDPADADPADELGRLDYLAEGEVAVEEMSDVLGIFTEQMQDYGALAEEYGPKAQGASSFKEKLTILRHFLDALKPLAEEMDSTAGSYLLTVEKIDAAMQIFLQDFEADPEQIHEPEVQGFVASMIGLCSVVEESGVGVTQNLHNARDMRGWSSIARPTARTLEHAFNTTLRAGEIIASWAERLRALPGWIEPNLLTAE